MAVRSLGRPVWALYERAAGAGAELAHTAASLLRAQTLTLLDRDLVAAFQRLQLLHAMLPGLWPAVRKRGELKGRRGGS